MKTEDARSLSAKAQEALRRLVVQAVREGLTQAEAARLFGVARGTVNGWMGLWEREGSPALKARRRGRLPCPRFPAKKKPIRAPKISRRAFAQGREDSGSTRGALWAQRARGGRRGPKNQVDFWGGVGWGGAGGVGLGGAAAEARPQKKKKKPARIPASILACLLHCRDPQPAVHFAFLSTNGGSMQAARTFCDFSTLWEHARSDRGPQTSSITRTFGAK